MWVYVHDGYMVLLYVYSGQVIKERSSQTLKGRIFGNYVSVEELETEGMKELHT